MDPNLDRRQFLGLGSATAIASVARLQPAPRTTDPAPALRAQRLSWAGVRLELGDRTILIDPWILPDIWDDAWTQPVVPVEIATRARSVLITHLHNDHFDSAAVTPRAGIPMSLTPEQAVGAAIALGAKLVCPIHYGLHDPKTYLEYPDAEALFLRTARERDVAARVVTPGDWLFR